MQLRILVGCVHIPNGREIPQVLSQGNPPIREPDYTSSTQIRKYDSGAGANH